MALKFTGLEAIQFGDTTELPIINPELKLRLKTIQDSTSDSAKDLMASCFPVNNVTIRAFMNNMADFDLARLHAYLINGETGLQMAEKLVQDGMASVIEKVKEQNG